MGNIETQQLQVKLRKVQEVKYKKSREPKL